MSGSKRLTIKALPAGERPRERLARSGPAALSDAELLAILLRTGDAASGCTALDLARLLLAAGDRAGGLRFLATATLEELRQVPGIGPVKAIQLKAAVELGRRLAAAAGFRPEITTPSDARRLLVAEMRHLEQEHFCAVLLDTKNRVISIELVSIGGLDTSHAEPREVFRTAIRKNAASIFLAHNHPSGDPTPSPEDLQVTKRLADAGRLLGIEVLDHLVIGDSRSVTLRELGLTF